MSTPLNVDVCPYSLLSNVYRSPTVVSTSYYSASVLPKCVNGMVPYRLYAEIYQAGNPYSGDVYIYIDGAQYGTVAVANGILDTVVMMSPGTHTISVVTQQQSTLIIKTVAVNCV